MQYKDNFLWKTDQWKVSGESRKIILCAPLLFYSCLDNLVKLAPLCWNALCYYSSLIIRRTCWSIPQLICVTWLYDQHAWCASNQEIFCGLETTVPHMAGAKCLEQFTAILTCPQIKAYTEILLATSLALEWHELCVCEHRGTSVSIWDCCCVSITNVLLINSFTRDAPSALLQHTYS